MSMCEECWGDAYMGTLAHPTKSQPDHYEELLEERKDNPCSPKQQAGQFWDEKSQMDSRFNKSFDHDI